MCNIGYIFKHIYGKYVKEVEKDKALTSVKSQNVLNLKEYNHLLSKQCSKNKYLTKAICI